MTHKFDSLPDTQEIAMSATKMMEFLDTLTFDELQMQATALRDEEHPEFITYSKKIFIPLTQLCRDVCHYCTFAHPPKKNMPSFLTPEQILDIAEKGAHNGCKEALFTLGDKPELRYAVVRKELKELGYNSTLSYLAEMARLVYEKTGLLPHLNPGTLTYSDAKLLRTVSVSQGLMLESLSDRLTQKGHVHYGSPDKDPILRLKTLHVAGELAIPFTTGILIGIGETRRERIESLLAIKELHKTYGHIQEVIIQNFRAKANTKMADAPEPSIEDLCWTIAVARLIFGPKMNIQAPPNLSPGSLSRLVKAGINDLGGVSPVTPDFVNPEAPWPHLKALEKDVALSNKHLCERLAVYPVYVKHASYWLEKDLKTATIRRSDLDGLARIDDWSPGTLQKPPMMRSKLFKPLNNNLTNIFNKVTRKESLSEEEIVTLFQARGPAFNAVCDLANQIRKDVSGDVVKYVVNRNINYTNVCYFKCQFCAFSKGKMSENLRGRPYDLEHTEISRRTGEAWARGATEVCMQGGIHPDYSGQTYLDICKAVKNAAPKIHIHAFSPLEVWQGAESLGLTLETFLEKLKDAGLGSLPGTAAEILDDDIRSNLCPDKIKTDEWLKVIKTAHKIGLRTTSTIMYGHIEDSKNCARHLIHLRELQKETGGFTEFVPLPFVHMEAPIYLKGHARKGPTYREAILMHAVARIVLYPHINNIQTSWVKMGPDGSMACLNAGANDLGGTLMNESITRAAGASWGQEFSPESMESLIRSIERIPEQRSTTYDKVDIERQQISFNAESLKKPINTTIKRNKKQKNMHS